MQSEAVVIDRMLKKAGRKGGGGGWPREPAACRRIDVVEAVRSRGMRPSRRSESLGSEEEERQEAEQACLIEISQQGGKNPEWVRYGWRATLYHRPQCYVVWYFALPSYGTGSQSRPGSMGLDHK